MRRADDTPTGGGSDDGGSGLDQSAIDALLNDGAMAADMAAA